MSAISDESVSQLIQTGESYRCELKSDLSSKDNKEKICRTICAMANDIKGSEEIGIIALGVCDDGNPCQISVTDELELIIQNIRNEGKITPLPSFTTHKRQYRGCDILCIEVHPALSTPVKYDGRIWIRPGNSTQLAKNEDELRLNEKRRSKDQPDDVQVLQHLRVSDLDISYFKSQYLVQAFAADILDANGRSTEEQLASTKMIGAASDPHPTVLGMLCLGLSPADAIPGAYVQFLKIAGLDLAADILDEANVHGHIADVIARIEAKFNAHNLISVDFTSQDRELRLAHYPKIAFEQLFRNAVMHRAYLGTHAPIRVYWYADRIEITNPGGPFGLVTQENFGHGPTDYRNPNLAGALKDLGFVQKFGAGISRARKELRENGNPELDLQVNANFVTAVMHQRS
jgi:ATP-dependent DNA helicase RecG